MSECGIADNVYLCNTLEVLYFLEVLTSRCTKYDKVVSFCAYVSDDEKAFRLDSDVLITNQALISSSSRGSWNAHL